MNPLTNLYKPEMSEKEVPFTPLSLPNLELWLDTIDSPITQDANHYVSVWEDISGNNRHATQTIPSEQFRFGVRGTPNGTDMMQTGISGAMILDLSFLVNTSFAMYLVTGHGSVGVNPKTYAISTDGYPYVNRRLHIGYFLPITAKFDLYNNPCDVTIPSMGAVDYKYQIWHYNFENGVGKNALYYQDGEEYRNAVSEGVANEGMLEADDAGIGVGYNHTNFFRGDMAAVLIYSTHHSETDETQMMNYLISKFGY